MRRLATALFVVCALPVAPEDAGHMINMEQPERFNRDLDAFLTGLALR